MRGDGTTHGFGQLLPSPAPLVASDFEGWFYTSGALCLVLLVALPWTLRRVREHHDWLPLLALGSGTLASLVEPLLDLVGHVRWAQNLPGPAFVAFGIDIPLLIPCCYALFMGMEAYWVCAIIRRGATTGQLFRLFAVVAASDAIMEHPGLITGVYEYYGDQPFEFYRFPFYWAFTNGVAIMTIGALLHYVWSRVERDAWPRIAVLPVGMIGTVVGELATGFPVFLAINMDIATWLQWLAGAVTILLSLAWIRLLADLVARETTADWTLLDLLRSRWMPPEMRAAFIRDSGRAADAAPPIP